MQQPHNYFWVRVTIWSLANDVLYNDFQLRALERRLCWRLGVNVIIVHAVSVRGWQRSLFKQRANSTRVAEPLTATLLGQPSSHDRTDFVVYEKTFVLANLLPNALQLMLSKIVEHNHVEATRHSYKKVISS